MAERALPDCAVGDASCTDRRTVISASLAGVLPGVAELWKHRYLIYVFVQRDVKVRYKQTLLGAGWAVLQPFLTMAVFSLVFGRIARISSEGVPYPLFVYCGLLPWQFFAQGLARSSNSLVENRYLLTRAYVPRAILPIAAVLGGLPDFAAAFVVLLGLMIYYRITPPLSALVVLPLLMMASATALGMSFFLAAWNVRFRDVGHVIPFFTQLWFFVTPVAYPVSLVPGRWRTLYALNPMAGVVEGLRAALLGTSAISGWQVVASALTVAGVLVLGLMHFQRVESNLADLI